MTTEQTQEMTRLQNKSNLTQEERDVLNDLLALKSASSDEQRKEIEQRLTKSQAKIQGGQNQNTGNRTVAA